MLSPSLDPTPLPTGAAPPTPPHADALDDIYGSAPNSPLLAARAHRGEILSDLPSRQRALDTDAYREGLSEAKGQYVQEGFDEGYALGAEVGLLVGWVLGVLQGVVAGVQERGGEGVDELRGMLEQARDGLVIEKIFGSEWVDEEGIWKWEVEGEGEDVTFKEVAAQHPLVSEWVKKTEYVAEKYRVDLEAVEKSRGEEAEAEDAL